MEPFTLASGFATITGLLAVYKNERRAAVADEYQAFTDWLNEHRHEKVVELLKSNHQLAESIKQVLSLQTDEFLARFDRLDAALAQLASRMEVFAPIAAASRPNAEISDQAVSIVRQLVDSGAEKIMRAKDTSGDPDTLALVPGQGRVEYNEPRFLEDDLRTLTELGLLDLRLGGKQRTENYYITRAAVSFVDVLPPGA